MKNRIRNILSIILIVFVGNALADKGVFNPHLAPDEGFSDKETLVTVSAEIGAEDLHISSVSVYQTTPEGLPISRLGQMYDDGTHGDEREADTIFTTQFNVAEGFEGKMYVRVSAAYQRDRNRYLSPVMEITIYEPLPDNISVELSQEIQNIQNKFENYLISMSLKDASQKALQDALDNPDITSAELNGNIISIIYKNRIRGVIFLNDPSNPVKGSGSSVPPNTLPDNPKFPGNDKLLIFAPFYDADLKLDANAAKSSFDNSVYMEFSPKPAVITKNSSASLDAVKTWGNYGTVIIDSHGGLWGGEVVISSGTTVNSANDTKYKLDLAAGRIGAGTSGVYAFYPSYITKHSGSMANTFFWLGSCDSIINNTLWSVLESKGAKVALGWSDTVGNSFGNGVFKQILNGMLSSDDTSPILTVKEAFDAVPDKTDGWCGLFGWCIGGSGATLTLKTANSDWNDYLFLEGGLVNGDFETGDWTGWTHGGDYDYRLISGSIKHGGANSAALGRWDTTFNEESPDPADEPFGYEWFYQDFVVPENITYLKFHWWMETYDTAVWDWFDVSIKNSSGNTLKTILSKAGKPGYDYGPYWTTSGWQEVTVDISSYRGQKIRIYFDQRLDGYGDQQRVYVDDVLLQ